MHILIVDDEALARQRLRTLLADCQAQAPQPHLHISEAAHAAQALALLQSPTGRSVDLLLLDIHMPGQDGLALAQQLRSMATPPALVFVSADTGHALDAFELDALDYLSKPVRLQRLQQALAKVQRQPHQNTPQPAPTEREALLIQERGRSERVPLDEVLYLKAEQKYLTLRTTGRTYVLDGALSDYEARYPTHFLRIHRNALVARHAVRALERHCDPVEGEGWAVRLRGLGELLTVSRRQLPAARAALNAPARAPGG
ncbi:MAG: LytTR family DNA-binding domain-containing protein [Comamonadaceae bacterium]|nr:LytTR family DNA-binding domain-containing protein [Comamonadaceae bacterium]